jgi:hypothetical protein
MMIPMIRSQTSDGIEVTKGIGLNDKYIHEIHMGNYGHLGSVDDH